MFRWWSANLDIGQTGDAEWPRTLYLVMSLMTGSRDLWSGETDTRIPQVIYTIYQDTSPPENMTDWHNSGLMLDQRRRRWANIEPALCQRLAFTEVTCKISNLNDLIILRI